MPSERGLQHEFVPSSSAEPGGYASADASAADPSAADSTTSRRGSLPTPPPPRGNAEAALFNSPRYFHDLQVASVPKTSGNQEEAAHTGAEVGAEEEGESSLVATGYVPMDDGYESAQGTSASNSLPSNVLDFVHENGRRYHRYREGRYSFPNDAMEQDRENLKHIAIKLLCGTLHYAPIGDFPKRILDIGTGTGSWAIEMGDLFPLANVLGIDLSPIQPQHVPPNVRFIVDDAESEWLYPRDHFDYVHTRHLVLGIKDWPKLLEQAFVHLRPGGWVEMQEPTYYPASANDSMPADHPFAQLVNLIDQGLKANGMQYVSSAARLANMARNRGFVNVTEKVLRIPIGTWPKGKTLNMVGLYWRANLVEGLQGIALGPLTRGCHWTPEQVEVFLVSARKSLLDNSCQLYLPFRVICAQKPETGL